MELPMPTVADILAELKTLGSESTKRTLIRHGAREPFYGVKIADLKKIQKRVKRDHTLALALYDTAISDAQYLAGLIADPSKMTKAQLQKWVKTAAWGMVGDYTVAWVAAESRFGPELARAWIDSKAEAIAASGWNTWSSIVSITPDEELDLDELVELLERVQKEIHAAPNRVRYVMNGFVIAVGSYVPARTARAKAVAKAIGLVEVDMGDTACQVPAALDYIAKVEKAGRLGKKRATAMC
jgi:3-methyladenine DNA glycosylase AlkD